MGISRFYRWISERYPLINESITSEMLPPFDNLYLDMNGIIHHCSHGNTGEIFFQTETDLFVSIFQYISSLVGVIKPRVLLYIAIDGVAPRAKMNQQRVRRFRSAMDRESQTKKASEMEKGRTEPSFQSDFDSNCITPGTAFMSRLTEALDFYVQYKLNEDRLWSSIEVIFSGSEVPGEGEHKIMDFIRRLKSQPHYHPSTRHCLYGLDADLIMLGLASHEHLFSLLREEITIGKQTIGMRPENRTSSKLEKFQLLHLCLLREYFEIEFCLTPPPSEEEIFIDSELLETGEEKQIPTHGKLESFKDTTSLLPESFHLIWNLERFIDDFILFCLLAGNDFLPHLPFTEIGAGGLHSLMLTYRLYLLEQVEEKGSSDPWITHECGTIHWSNFYKFLLKWAEEEENLLSEKIADSKYFKNKKKNKRANEPKRELQPFKNFLEVPTKNSGNQLETDSSEMVLKDSSESDVFLTAWDAQNPPESPQKAIEQYYLRKMKIDIQTTEGVSELNSLVQLYFEGLQWTLWYYFRGPRSWSWFYRYYYPPYAMSLVQYEPFKNGTVEICFDLGHPFTPFQQLMSVLPSNSSHLVPICYRHLMTNDDSPLKMFYPNKFDVDMEGVSVPWGGIALIPFIVEDTLIKTLEQATLNRKLTDEERRRNKFGNAYKYRLNKEDIQMRVISPLPDKFRNIENCSVEKKVYHHPQYPSNQKTFKNNIISDIVMEMDGFPSLRRLNIESAHFAKGIVVFNGIQGRHPGLHLCIKSQYTSDMQPDKDSAQPIRDFRQLLTSPTVIVDYPFEHLAKPIGLWSPHFYYRISPPNQLRSIRRKESVEASRFLTPAEPNELELDSCQLSEILSNQWHVLEDKGVHVVNNESEKSIEMLQMCLYDGLTSYGSALKELEFSYFRRAIAEDDKKNGGTQRRSSRDQHSLRLSEIARVSLADVMVELLMVEETIIGSSGRFTGFHFAYKPTYRPLAFVSSHFKPRIEPIPYSIDSPTSCFSQLKEGMTVICVNKKSPVFGCIGKIDKIGSSPTDVRSVINYRGQSYLGNWTLQEELMSAVIEDDESLIWFSLDQIAARERLPMSVLSWITRSVFVCGSNRTRYDIGMNLISSRKKCGTPLCLPGYTRVVSIPDRKYPGQLRNEFSYSTLASDLIHGYKVKYPNVFETLIKIKKSSSGSPSHDDYDRTRSKNALIASDFFPLSTDPNWHLEQLSKWCSTQPFAQINMVGPDSMAVSPIGVCNIERIVNRYLRQNETISEVVAYGAKEIWPIELNGTLPDHIMAASSEEFHRTKKIQYQGLLELGQRVVYAKWNGVISFGTISTVIGTTYDEDVAEQLVEIVTDIPSLGCSNLKGRCSQGRGLVVPASSLIALCPSVISWGLLPPTKHAFQNWITPAMQKLQRRSHYQAPKSIMISESVQGFGKIVGKTSSKKSGAQHLVNNAATIASSKHQSPKRKPITEAPKYLAQQPKGNKMIEVVTDQISKQLTETVHSAPSRDPRTQIKILKKTDTFVTETTQEVVSSAATISKRGAKTTKQPKTPPDELLRLFGKASRQQVEETQQGRTESDEMTEKGKTEFQQKLQKHGIEETIVSMLNKQMTNKYEQQQIDSMNELRKPSVEKQMKKELQDPAILSYQTITKESISTSTITVFPNRGKSEGQKILSLLNSSVGQPQPQQPQPQQSQPQQQQPQQPQPQPQQPQPQQSKPQQTKPQQLLNEAHVEPLPWHEQLRQVVPTAQYQHNDLLSSSPSDQKLNETLQSSDFTNITSTGQSKKLQNLLQQFTPSSTREKPSIQSGHPKSRVEALVTTSVLHSFTTQTQSPDTLGQFFTHDMRITSARKSSMKGKVGTRSERGGEELKSKQQLQQRQKQAQQSHASYQPLVEQSKGAKKNMAKLNESLEIIRQQSVLSSQPQSQRLPVGNSQTPNSDVVNTQKQPNQQHSSLILSREQTIPQQELKNVLSSVIHPGSQMSLGEAGKYPAPRPPKGVPRFKPKF